MENFVASPERLIIGALLGFAVLLFMIIKLKVQPKKRNLSNRMTWESQA